MSFGVTYDFRNPAHAGRSFVQLYRETLNHIVAAEDMGFDTVWLTEHHFTDDGYLPSLLPMAAAIAQRTRKVHIGTNVILLPLHHPLRVAEDGAVVDILSNGRFALGAAVGYRPVEFEMLGVSVHERGGRIREQLEIIAQAWMQGSVSVCRSSDSAIRICRTLSACVLERGLNTLPGMISRLCWIASVTNSVPVPQGAFGKR